MFKIFLTLFVLSVINADTDAPSVSSIATTQVTGDQTFERSDLTNLDFSMETIRSLYPLIQEGKVWRVNLADGSYFTLHRVAEIVATPNSERVPAELILKVYFYNPGDHLPGTDRSTAVNLAFSSVYVWNDLLQGLVPKVCEENVPKITNVEHKCEDAIHTANAVLQLQVTGSVQQQELDDAGLERCISSKITSQRVVNSPYMMCLIKILGNPKYKNELVSALIKEKESQGYVCNEMGECYQPEDPAILEAMIENAKKQLANQEPVPVRIYRDNRTRYCNDQQLTPNFSPISGIEQFSYDTYEYGCGHWVEKMYFYMDGFKMKWATEYVSYKDGPNGTPVNVSRELQYTSRFNLDNSDQLVVDWQNGERITGVSVWYLNEMENNPNGPRATFAMEFVLTNGDNSRKARFGYPENDQMMTYSTPYYFPINGEIVGWDVANINVGTIVRAIDVKV